MEPEHQGLMREPRHGLGIMERLQLDRDVSVPC